MDTSTYDLRLNDYQSACQANMLLLPTIHLTALSSLRAESDVWLNEHWWICA